MSPEEFARKLHLIYQRMEHLKTRSQIVADKSSEELQQASAELRQTQEELRQQNDELIAAHRELDIQRRRYQELFELAPDAYLVTDLNGIIQEANRFASHLLGVAPRYLPGKALAAYVSSAHRSRFRALLVRRKRRQEVRTHPFRLRASGGTQFDAQLTYSVASGPDGEPIGIRWLIRDVSDQEALARQTRDLNSELELKVAQRTTDLRAAQRLTEELFVREQAARHAAEASEAQSRHVQKLESIGVLAGGIAHDFNNLLHVVLGNADIALSHLRRESPVREPLEEVVRATLRAADLTRQLLAYSGKGAFVVQRLDLSSEMREMATLLRTAISKQANLVWELAPNLPAVSADPTQVRQIVMNLITNASDALGEKGGAITLRTGLLGPGDLDKDHFDAPPKGQGIDDPMQGPFVYLEVGDTGSGMTPETLSRIFDPFFSTKFTGRGLGLAAVMGIVRAHKGLIRIRTEPALGTSFRVLFPPADGLADESEAPAAGQRSWRGSGTVLVVDDEEGVREVAERMLQEIGFETITAADGREALDIIDSAGDTITAVLLDLSMPRMGGQETCIRLRRSHPQLPVVLMSGYTEHVVAQQFGDSGSGLTAFLQKPFLAEDLVVAFRRFVEVQT